MTMLRIPGARSTPKRARDGLRSAQNGPTPANGPRGNPSANQRFAEGFRRELRSHNPKVAGSNPAPATMNDEGLADAAAANPFRLAAVTSACDVARIDVRARFATRCRARPRLW